VSEEKVAEKEAEKSKLPPLRLTGLIAGPTAFLLLMLGTGIEGLSPAGQAAAAITLLMAIWWVTEAIPIYATALVPIVLFPLTGVLDVGETTAHYGHELIYLFLGGFLLAIAIQKWGLHRRIALSIVSLFGTNPTKLVLGFMVATGFLSMWISNTASAMMMVPIGLAVVNQLTRLLREQDPDIDIRPGHFPFGMALMLGIAYGASIGGVATIIGSPPNAIFVGYVSQIHDVEISFLRWMFYGLPVAAVGMIIAWYYLTRVAHPVEIQSFPGLIEVIDEERRGLGTLKGPEARVLVIFCLVAGLWILRGLTAPWLAELGLGGLNDTTIAILGGLLLFLVPAKLEEKKFLLEWDDAHQIPWGILILFGGGLALAGGIEASGLAAWMAERLHILENAPILIVLAVLIVLIIFLTEVTSNTSTASIFVPMVAVLAVVIGVHPYVLMIAVVTAASCAFMLPIATPPNAVVFASEYVTMRQMMRAGIWLNIVFAILITAVAYLWLPFVWGL
jgi:solute carrier family 13 (sodium-dependent dicarboxylate transporter), member 2/3/5